MVKQALIHVENPAGIVNFARFLTDFGWTIYSANKTEELLLKENIPVQRERGLVKHNLFLSDHSSLIRKLLTAKNDEDLSFSDNEVVEDSISLVCINVLPGMVLAPKENQIESIMNRHDFYISSILRDCFVNYKNLLILTDPEDYEEAIVQLRNDNITDSFRTYLAAKALNMISAYDGGISSSILMDKTLNEGCFMNYLMFPFIKQEVFPSGANKQQSSCLYRYPSEVGAVNGFNRYAGVKADFNVVNDAALSWEIISSLYSNLRTQYAVESTNCDGYDFTTQFSPLTGTVFTIAMKFRSVLGASTATNVLDSFKKTFAFEDDIEGICFGCSAVIDEDAAMELVKQNLSAIVAPGFTVEAKDILLRNPDIRLIPIAQTNISPFDLQLINGGLVFQTKDTMIFEKWAVKTRIRPTQAIADQLAFGMVLAMGSRTYCAVLVKNNSIAGISQGARSAAKAVAHALEGAIEQKKQYWPDDEGPLADVLICDTSLPFTPVVKEIIDSGVTAIIQTGGNSSDDEFINYCNEKGVSLIFTGTTHISY